MKISNSEFNISKISLHSEEACGLNCTEDAFDHSSSLD